MKLLRALYGVLVFVGFPVGGFLLGMTIHFHFWDRVELTGDTPLHAVARSCEARGPVTWRGFGTWYRCQTDVVNASGKTVKQIKVNWLNPSLIGEPVPVSRTRHGDYEPKRVDGGGLGMAFILPGAVLWLFAFAFASRPVLRDYRPSPTEKFDWVRIKGRRKWIRGKLVFGLLFFSAVGVAMQLGGAFEDAPQEGVVTVLVWLFPVLLLLNVVRRAVWWPSVTISERGIDAVPWAEISSVRLSADHVLTVQTADRSWRVGRFGPEEADQIDTAVRQYGKSAPYQRESAGCR